MAEKTQPDAALFDAMASDDRGVTDDRLEALRDAARKQRKMKADVVAAEVVLKNAKDNLFELEHVELPDLFDKVGVDHVGVSDDSGKYDAILKPYYRANISADWPDDQRSEAFKWLDDNGHGDLIRSVITIELGRGDVKLAKAVGNYLDKRGIPYQQRLGVPWQTLTAFLKEQIEDVGTIPPLDILGATVGKIVILKDRKEK